MLRSSWDEIKLMKIQEAVILGFNQASVLVFQ